MESEREVTWSVTWGVTWGVAVFIALPGQHLSQRESLRRKKGKWARPAVEPYQGWPGARRSGNGLRRDAAATGYSDDEANEAIRLSWCHLTPEVDWEAVAARIFGLR